MAFPQIRTGRNKDSSGVVVNEYYVYTYYTTGPPPSGDLMMINIAIAGYPAEGDLTLPDGWSILFYVTYSNDVTLFIVAKVSEGLSSDAICEFSWSGTARAVAVNSYNILGGTYNPNVPFEFVYTLGTGTAFNTNGLVPSWQSLELNGGSYGSYDTLYLAVAVIDSDSQFLSGPSDMSLLMTRDAEEVGGVGVALAKAEDSNAGFGEEDWITDVSEERIAVLFAIAPTDYSLGPTFHMNVNIGGTYKESESISVNIDGTWKDVEKMFVNIGGTWKEVT